MVGLEVFECDPKCSVTHSGCVCLCMEGWEIAEIGVVEELVVGHHE